MTLKFLTFLVYLLFPVILLLVLLRLLKGKEDWRRLKERFGFPSRLARQMMREKKRPIVWVHGASVGEISSALPLVRLLHEEFPDVFFLLTSGTRGAAKKMESYHQDYAVHQYSPIDFPGCVRRFLNFWKPILVLRIDSDFWPFQLAQIKDRQIPHVLVNGRMSEKSFQKTHHSRWLSRLIASSFQLCLVKNKDTFYRLKKLGVRQIERMPDLKFLDLLDPLPSLEIPAFLAFPKDRPVWHAAVVFKEEIPFVLEIAALIRRRIPGLLTVISPRHPDHVSKSLFPPGTGFLSQEDRVMLKTPVYVNDRFGSMPLFYHLVKPTLMGRSFFEVDPSIQGSNPLEALKDHGLVLTGPYVYNFEDIYATLEREGLAKIIHSNRAEDYARVIEKILKSSTLA